MPPDPPSSTGKGASEESVKESGDVLGEVGGVTQFFATVAESGLAIKKTLDAAKERAVIKKHGDEEARLVENVSKIRSTQAALSAKMKKFEQELESPDTPQPRVSALKSGIMATHERRREALEAQLQEELQKLKQFQMDDKLEVRMTQESVERWKTGRIEVGAGV